ncbi:MAG: Tenacibaculum phage PTm1 [Bacteroidota bacterium]
MSNINGPNFYNIDFEREVVMQGKSSTFLTINRNDDVLAQDETLYVLFYPNTRTFESVGTFEISQTSAIGGQCNLTSQGFIDQDLSTVNTLGFNNIGPGLYVKNTQDFLPNSEGPVIIEKVEYLNTLSGIVTKVSLTGPTGGSEPFVGATGSLSSKNINVGFYSEVDKENWKFNTVSLGELENLVYSVPATGTAIDYSSVINPFDGTAYNPTGSSVGGFTGTGFVSRDLLGFSSSKIISSSPELDKNRGITVRIDYEGNNDSHLKLNILIFRYNPSFGPLSQAFPVIMPESITGPNNPNSFASEFLGLKSGNVSMIPTEFSDNIDYQELHIFGYAETTVRTSRTTYQNNKNTSNTVYDDRSSYALLKSNPKLSGNVKLTVDSKGELSLNSFDANSQLSDSRYKRFTISPESTYQKDLYTFFKDTPEEVVFDLFQADEDYQSTKTSLFQQYDNFYNYGVEQLGSKFYDEDLSFLAPLWMRKVLPDYFVIFRVEHPLSLVTYNEGSVDDLFKDVFKDARIIKTFDMRDTSKLGKYIRKIVNDPRFIERPIEVSFDEDASTVWNGIVYKSGTIAGKGELLNDFWTTDKPIKEFENFITNGFERNGIISTNLINLEFLFDDPEANIYSINRYFGLYVSEIQLAEFELASSVLGKIPNQSPPPKPGVDGEPYSTRSFVQSNPNGIQLPIEYYHNTSFNNNTSSIPFYQGNVIGKFPLPAMVDDPLRIFYIKDRDDVFKRAISLSEVDYGFTGTTDYKRVTQVKLFDTQEDISKYGGPIQMISQNDALLLNEGQSQLIINLIDQGNNGSIIADDECLEINVKNYNNTDKNSQYYFQVSAVGGTATSFTFFQDQSVTSLSSSFVQPNVGENVTASFDSTQDLVENETIFIVSGGFYKIVNLISSTSAEIKNLGNPENSAQGTTINANALVGSYPTGIATYAYTALSYKLDIDTNISLDLEQGYSGNSSNYALLDSYEIIIEYPKYTLSVLNGSSGLNVIIKEQFKQFRWKMFANPTGLQKGKSWAFPVQDPNGYDWISNFSNDGNVNDIAKAISNCINSFDNSPAYALAEDNKIILKSKLKPLDGNTIEFKRHMISGKSYINNLGFYENGNVKVATNISTVSYAGLTSNESIGLNIVNNPNIAGDTFYFVKILKTSSGANIIIRSDVNALNVSTIQNTGTYYSFFTTNSNFSDTTIPFSIDTSNISLGSYQNFVIKLTVDTNASQLFIGGAQRRRSRARIAKLDGERYFQNNKSEILTGISLGSNIINVSTTEGIYVGGAVSGTGIPVNSYVLQINQNTKSVTINNTATETGNFNLSFGNLSILNNELFLQQWFQTAKSQYSRLLPWNVQGKYVYSLPYLDEPIFDNKNLISAFNEKNTYSIIEINDASQEFYLSDEKRIVAYEMYRPTIGLFSMFPIKEFDFDFFLSDYSYSPILETFRYFLNESIGENEYLELSSDENYVLLPQIIDPSDPGGIKKMPSFGSYQLINRFSYFGFIRNRLFN